MLSPAIATLVAYIFKVYTPPELVDTSVVSVSKERAALPVLSNAPLALPNNPFSVLNMEILCGVTNEVDEPEEKAGIARQVLPPSYVTSTTFDAPTVKTMLLLGVDTAYKFNVVPEVSVVHDDPELILLYILPVVPTV